MNFILVINVKFDHQDFPSEEIKYKLLKKSELLVSATTSGGKDSTLQTEHENVYSMIFKYCLIQ